MYIAPVERLSREKGIEDPQETRNLIDDPAYAEVLFQLKERMLTWYMATADIVPIELDRRW